MRKLLFLSTLVVFLLSLGYSTTTITWINPSSDGNYYWEGNLTLNVTTNVNANCSYELYNTTSKITGPVNFSVGQNSTIHLTNISIDSLYAAQNISIITFCYNISNFNDNATSTRTFLRDINDKDCSGLTDFSTNGLTHNWTLGHNLRCNRSSFNILADDGSISLGKLTADNDTDVFDCNGYIIQGNGTGLALSIHNSNKKIINCIIKNFEAGIFLSTPISNTENITIYNNTFTNITSPSYGVIFTNISTYLYPNILVNTNIINNQFYNSENAINTSRITNSVITNNYFENITNNIMINNYSLNINITNNTFTNSNTGISVENGNSIVINHNNFINISGLKFIDVRLNQNILNNNNYWGHSDCSLFKYMRDSNTIIFIDNNPVSQPNNWTSFKSCNNSTFQNISVRRYDGTPTINPVTPVNYHYDSNGSKVFNDYDIYLYYYYSNRNSAIVDFNISLNYYALNFTVEGLMFSNSSCYSYSLTNITSAYGADGTYRLNLTILNDSCFIPEAQLSTNLTVLIFNIFLIDTNNKTDAFTLALPYNLNLHSLYPILSENSTNLSQINDLTSIENLTFEITNYSKIRFLENISLTDMDFIHSLMNFANYLSLNRTEVSLNSSELKILNKSTEITFYNITSNLNESEIKNKILMDGKPCQSCNITYYNNTTGMLVFRVYHWTTYEVDTEPPVITSKNPSGTLSSGTTSVVLSATTNENAVCKYDVSQKSFENMSYTLDGNQTTHTKSISVSSGHSYTYYVLCKDSVNNTMSSPETISFSVSEESSGSSSGSSSGAVIIIPKIEKDKPLTIKLKKDSVKLFKTKSGEQHKLTIKNVFENRATIILESDPVELTLSVGESRDIDLNSDNNYDITVVLNSIDNGYVNITIKDYIPAEIESTFENTTQPENQPSADKNETNTKPPVQKYNNQSQQNSKPINQKTQNTPQNHKTAWIWILIAIIVSGIGLYFYYYR